LSSDAVTTLGTGVDGAVRRIEIAYDTQGNPYLFTSYDAASAGNVVNQVQRAFNGLGQLITEYQSHSGAVNTGTTPKVQYTYSEMAGGANHSRLTSITYPNGKVLTYNYASGPGLPLLERLANWIYSPISHLPTTAIYLLPLFLPFGFRCRHGSSDGGTGVAPRSAPVSRRDAREGRAIRLGSGFL
jgi:hypothetical protein